MFIIVKFSFASTFKFHKPNNNGIFWIQTNKGIPSCVMVAKIQTELILYLYQQHHMTWLLETSRDTCIEIHKLKRWNLPASLKAHTCTRTTILTKDVSKQSTPKFHRVNVTHFTKCYPIKCNYVISLEWWSNYQILCWTIQSLVKHYQSLESISIIC